ncbi:MAG: hypothetical protein HYX71_06310 [Opitutae bacterium]|nr:hypothetical protein [Opitutae bacterium]
MDWVLDHLQLIIAIAGSIAWWLSKNRKGAGEEEASTPEATFDDPELAERTRKIREEIQRKIAERGRGYANEQPVRPQVESDEPPPVIREVVVTQGTPVRRASTVHYEAQRQAEILEEQAALAEKLAEAQMMKTAALKRAQYEAATADHASDARALSRSTVLDDLREPAALRRAFILREVLGPPVALR